MFNSGMTGTSEIDGGTTWRQLTKVDRIVNEEISMQRFDSGEFCLHDFGRKKPRCLSLMGKLSFSMTFIKSSQTFRRSLIKLLCSR